MRFQRNFFTPDAYLTPTTCLWAGGAIMLLFFTSTILYLSPFVALFVFGAYGAVGLGLFAAQVGRLLLTRGKSGWLGLLLVPAVGCFVWGLGSWWTVLGDRVVQETRFQLLRPVYERVLEAVAAGRIQVTQGRYWFVRFEVDPGPPVRVAFPYVGGIIDNWQGTVYDPTDALASAHGWRPTTGYGAQGKAEIEALFGGDLVKCRPLADHFYRCSFT